MDNSVTWCKHEQLEQIWYRFTDKHNYGQTVRVSWYELYNSEGFRFRNHFFGNYTYTIALQPHCELHGWCISCTGCIWCLPCIILCIHSLVNWPMGKKLLNSSRCEAAKGVCNTVILVSRIHICNWTIRCLLYTKISGWELLQFGLSFSTYCPHKLFYVRHFVAVNKYDARDPVIFFTFVEMRVIPPRKQSLTRREFLCLQSITVTF